MKKPHTFPETGRKKTSILTSSWEGRDNSQLIPCVTRMPAEPVSQGRAGPSTCREHCEECTFFMCFLLLLCAPESQQQQIFFSNRTTTDLRGMCRAAQGPTHWYKTPRSTETSVTHTQPWSGEHEMKLLEMAAARKIKASIFVFFYLFFFLNHPVKLKLQCKNEFLPSLIGVCTLIIQEKDTMPTE